LGGRQKSVLWGEGSIRVLQGQYFDEETGLAFNRHRYYDPHAGRFISKDPIGLLGGVNPQFYAPNPTGWVDPLGLSPYRRKNGQFAKKPGPKPAPKESVHGNCLCNTNPAVGYILVDRNSGEIVKYGETAQNNPTSRYTTAQYNEMNAKMIIVERGSKEDMHKWQHEKIMEYKAKNNGARPKYNFNDY
jgi:RHS repeat-associated protein